MTSDEGECLGFNEVQVGSGLVFDSVENKKVVYVRLEDDGLQKVFLKPCVPVSEVEELIKKLEARQKRIFGLGKNKYKELFYQGILLQLDFIISDLKELGLSKTRKEPEIPDISPFLGYMLKKKEVGK